MNTEHQAPLAPMPASPARLKALALGIAGLLVGLAIGGISAREHHEQRLEQASRQAGVPVVSTVHALQGSSSQQLALPGTLQALDTAQIYARVNGYLKQWSVDIGTPVRRGQVLAEIETPELDEQLQQALATLETAKAQMRLAEITARRWQEQLKTDSVSQQEADEKNGDFEAKKTITAAAKANVDRLRALSAFKVVRAPFDGVVTTRNTDVGALINAGQQSGHELFTVADIHKLRLYVNVPQNIAPQIQLGGDIAFEVPGQTGKRFSARVVADAHAVNESTGTVLTQLEFDNKEGLLRPGAFANVDFQLPSSPGAMSIPATALLFHDYKPYVAVLQADGHVRLKPVGIARDLGTRVELASGVDLKDALIDNPPDSLHDGDLVQQAVASGQAPAQAANQEARK